jgi:hypothetical protein
MSENKISKQREGNSIAFGTEMEHYKIRGF